MRAYDHDHDGPVVPRPKAARPHAQDAGAAARAAAGGRWDAVSAGAILGLQRSAGNQATVALVQRLQKAPTGRSWPRQAPFPGSGAFVHPDLHFQRRSVLPASRGSSRSPRVTDIAVQRFTDEDVKVRAYYIWEKKGKPEQDRQAQQEDYFRARKELTQEERAYYIWEKKGKPQQDRQAQQEDYFRARRELEAEKLVDDDKDLNQGVAAEIKASVRAPELINQAQFNFCGPNDLLMAIALKDPVAYVKYVLDVHAAEREFQAGLLSQGRTAKLGQMSVAMDPSVLGAQAAGFYREFVTDPSISQTDWMSMASLRKQATATAPAPIVTQDVQDILDAFQGPGGASAALGAMKSPADLETAIMWLKQEFERTPGQTLEGMAVAPASQQKAIEILRKIAEGTSSDEVAQWMTKYGATDITNTAKYDRGRTTQDLQSANTDLAAGKSVMLQIDARGAQGDHLSVTFNPTKGHWVLMKTPFTFSAPIWSCEVYTWGAVHTLKIVERRIKDAYYGRVSATIAAP